MSKLPDPNDLDWGAMSKKQFKYMEMAYELADEEDEALTKPRTQIQTPKKKMYKTQEVLAVAFAAQAKNGGYVKVTERFNEPENKTRFANKELVKLHYSEPSQWIPPDYVALTVTEDDYENVDIAVKHFRRYTLGVIGDQLTGFQKDVFEAVNSDEVDGGKLGVLAYVPELVKREVEENKFKKLLRTQYHASQDVGKEGDDIEGVFKIINRFYSEQWQSYNYIADYMGNLVSFMNKYDHAIGDHKKFKAKVKGHGKNRTFEVSETRLNYVKLYKV
jgi:hypothetical protein